MNNLLFNIKHKMTGNPKAVIIPRPCKATTNEATWMQWMEKFPDAEFFTKEIGSRVYFMVAEKSEVA